MFIWGCGIVRLNIWWCFLSVIMLIVFIWWVILLMVGSCVVVFIGCRCILM